MEDENIFFEDINDYDKYIADKEALGSIQYNNFKLGD